MLGLGGGVLGGTAVMEQLPGLLTFSSGSQQAIVIPDNDALSCTSPEDLSISMWTSIDTSGTAERGLMGKVDEWSLRMDSNDRITFIREDNDTAHIRRYEGGNNIQHNTLVHLVVVAPSGGNKNDLVIYINGALPFSAGKGGNGTWTNAKNTSSDLYIGACSGGTTDVNAPVSKYQEGMIRNVAMWDKALSASEVTALYNGGQAHDVRTALSTNLVGYWPMNEGGGEVVKDLSTNSNDGVLVNSPTWNPE